MFESHVRPSTETHRPILVGRTLRTVEPLGFRSTLECNVFLLHAHEFARDKRPCQVKYYANFTDPTTRAGGARQSKSPRGQTPPSDPVYSFSVRCPETCCIVASHDRVREPPDHARPVRRDIRVFHDRLCPFVCPYLGIHCVRPSLVADTLGELHHSGELIVEIMSGFILRYRFPIRFHFHFRFISPTIWRGLCWSCILQDTPEVRHCPIRS